MKYTYNSPDDVLEVARFVCQAVNGWTENPERMIPYFTQDGGWEFPFAPTGFDLFFKEVRGAEAMKRYFTSLVPYMENLDIGPVENWTIHTVQAPDTYVYEYTGTATIKGSGKLYRQNYISIVTLEGGKIKTYREHWDPYVALLDFGLARPVDGEA
ncbi:nuclear transport factor 2 family protein [Pseudomonas chlororaphis]|uniref:SnoaL-like domain-containing protein n=1 Tax=Pseudomonas chlororaphis subsp. aureofaciens TaxID=587851 RepID=A0AAD1E7X1_9PSED|nr:nuclear transport factor 2 family protein [Pseudomonas chlororaphis]AZE31608.1 hypothetical protein C4K07_4845 [Pseudomonas chlororaphis subsp. aureofaciens]